MTLPRGNPNWVKGMKSPNPSGGAKPERMAARSLALACREAASDEEIAEWLLEIAAGRWPEIRPAKGKSSTETPLHMTEPPDGTHRMAALKEFLLRRDGQPMQAVILKADIEARARRIENASDAIEIETDDPAVAGALEAALFKALGGSMLELAAGASASAPSSNTSDVIDVEAVEVP